MHNQNCSQRERLWPFYNQKPYDPMKLTTILAALLLPLLLWASSPANTPFQFLDGDISEVQKKAAEEGKLYFLHFTADYVMTCDWMKKVTFSDEKLLRYLEGSYLAVQVDINRSPGMQLQHQYEVTQLPTTLVFSTRGQLLGRHAGTIPPGRMMALLQSYDTPANRVKPGAPQPQREEVTLLSCPRPILELSKPRLVPSNERQAAPQAASAPAQTVAEPSDSYLTVQVGVFGSRSNALAAKQKIEGLSTHPVRLVKGKAGDSEIYRLYTGIFYERSPAAIYRQRLNAQGVEGFLKTVEP